MNTLVVYHRGGGKSLGYPPNCIATLRWAIESGAGAVEYDVAVARDKDRRVMAMIEPKILKRHNLDINNLDWNDLRKMNMGNDLTGPCGVATMKEVLNLIDQKKIVQQIHLKSDNPETLTTIMSELENFENVTVTSFDPNMLMQLKQVAPGLKTGWLVMPDNKGTFEGMTDVTQIVSTAPGGLEPYGEDELQEIKDSAQNCRADIVILCGPRIQEKNNVLFFRRDGFEVGAWGVGSNLELAEQLIELGVDRFTLDNPEELKKSATE